MWAIRWVESTGSTNADLMEAALRQGPHGLVLVADHQTAGRGRLDRTWEAPHGVNLLMSILIRTVPTSPHHLTQAVAIAAAEACEGVAAERGRSIRVDLKWPNDVLIDGRKVAGILASAGSFPGGPAGGVGPDFVVVGLGLNIGWAPDGAISLARAMAGGTGSALTGSDIRDLRDEVLLAVLDRLEELLASEIEIPARYRRRLATLGRDVRIELPGGGVLEGRVVGIETDGRLVVLDACAITHRFDVGDIVHLR
ncbi:MAG: biotin--[acetyl-CoA-carboxylase] ligase [Ilumatobacteraceae bacterium]